MRDYTFCTTGAKMAGLVTKVCIEHFDLPSSPHPPSGEVTIQGEIHPPGRINPKTKALIPEDKLDEEDFIIYNRCLIFTSKEEHPAMTHRARHKQSNKQRRIGRVPKIWSNFYMRSYIMDPAGAHDIRVMGLAYEGQHNGRDARAFPVSAGRLAVLVHGAASGVIDHRFLDNACFGDFLEVIPVDSGLRLNSASEKYGIPIVRNVSPASVHDVNASFGVKSVVAGARAPSVNDLSQTMVAYNALGDIARGGADTLVDPHKKVDGNDAQTRFLYARVGSKMWEYKGWGMPVGSEPVATPFEDDHDVGAKWGIAGFGGNAELLEMARWFGVEADGTFQTAEVKMDKNTGIQLFQQILFDDAGTKGNGAFMMNPFLRLPVRTESNILDQDAILYGSPDAPSFIAQAAKALTTKGDQKWSIPVASPLFVRVVNEWKMSADGVPTKREYNAAATMDNTNNGGGDFEALPVGDTGDIIDNFNTWIERNAPAGDIQAAAAAKTLFGTKSDLKDLGIKGNANTVAKIIEAEISKAVVDSFPTKEDFAKAFMPILQRYVRDDTNSTIANRARVSFGAGADAVDRALSTFCTLCSGDRGITKTPNAAGRLVFGSKWDEPNVFGAEQKKYLETNFLKKFVGFPPTIVMATINSAFNVFWTEHPALRPLYGFSTPGVTTTSMILKGPSGATVSVPFENFFGVQYRSDADKVAAAGDIGDWQPHTGAIAPAAQTLARLGHHALPADYDAEDLVEANQLSTASGFVHKALLDAASTGSHYTPSPHGLTVTNKIDEVKAQLAAIPPDPRRFIGVFMEQTPNEPEVRFMLRSHMPS